MKSLDLSRLTLADLEGTFALDDIRVTAKQTGRSPADILAEVVAQPLSMAEITIALQCRAEDIVDQMYEARQILPFRARA